MRGLDPEEPPPILMTPDEVATLLRTTRKGIYTAFERGQIPGGVRIGRRLLFDRARLVEWLRARSVAEGK